MPTQQTQKSTSFVLGECEAPNTDLSKASLVNLMEETPQLIEQNHPSFLNEERANNERFLAEVAAKRKLTYISPL